MNIYKHSEIHIAKIWLDMNIYIHIDIHIANLCDVNSLDINIRDLDIAINIDIHIEYLSIYRYRDISLFLSFSIYMCICSEVKIAFIIARKEIV